MSAEVEVVNGIRVGPGVARIRPQFLVPKDSASDAAKGNGQPLPPSGPVPVTDGEPEEKKPKIEENEKISDEKGEGKKDKHKYRGQNKNRPRPPKFLNEDKLCPFFLDGKVDGEVELICPRVKEGGTCQFLHDVDKYLASKKDAVEGDCFLYQRYGKCHRGLTCLFASSHVKDGKNLIQTDLWSKMEPEFEATHKQLLDKETQIALRKHKFDFKNVEKIYSSNCDGGNANATIKTLGAVTDADLVKLRIDEVKKIDWKDKLYLSPLTTVGNLPFRRLCVEMGADITCSEMSLATSILQGNTHEFALHRRHPSEKLWGVQLCASNGVICAKAAHALAECGIDYDFVDLNMGCPLDPIYRQGAGSGLMCRTNKFHSMVKGMSKVLASQDKPFTVKMRTGVKLDKNIAHTLIEYCRDNGVSAVTLHGRTREQRYLRHADWNYIGTCAKIADPMALFGNGDILSWDDYQQRKALSNVTGVMIGRGALIKPWVFQEIKEQRHIDLNSSDRLELIRKYVNYGLDHWGSDTQGVTTTRRFLLEWLSFFHRYIPHGILEDPPQRINQRPPKYAGRDEMETLLASPNSADWIKISEMFLGPVPEFFEFVPKHKANAWANG